MADSPPRSIMACVLLDAAYRIAQVVSTGSALPDDVEFCTSVRTTGCPSAKIWEQGDTAWILVSQYVTMNPVNSR